MRELLLVSEPETFKATGFQLGAMHVERRYDGPLTITYLGWPTTVGLITTRVRARDAAFRSAAGDCVHGARPEIMCKKPRARRSRSRESIG